MAAAASSTLTPFCRRSEHKYPMMGGDTNLLNWILKVTVATLAAICFATVSVLLFGLFNDSVNNDKIFEIIGPAFNTVVGAFVGLLGGLSLNRGSGSSGCKKE